MTPQTPETPHPDTAIELEADDLSSVTDADAGASDATAEPLPANPEPGAAELVPEPA